MLLPSGSRRKRSVVVVAVLGAWTGRPVVLVTNLRPGKPESICGRVGRRDEADVETACHGFLSGCDGERKVVPPGIVLAAGQLGHAERREDRVVEPF